MDQGDTEDTGRGSTSLLHTHVPIVTAVLVGIWLIGTTVTLTVQWVSIGTKIDLLATQMDNRLSALETANLNRWTLEMHELWCIKTEQKNPNWKCGDLPRLYGPHAKAGSTEYWRTEKDEPK